MPSNLIVVQRFHFFPQSIATLRDSRGDMFRKHIYISAIAKQAERRNEISVERPIDSLLLHLAAAPLVSSMKVLHLKQILPEGVVQILEKLRKSTSSLPK